MELADSFKYLVIVSQIVGIFPIEVSNSLGGPVFRESRLHLMYSKAVFSFALFAESVYAIWAFCLFFREFDVLSNVPATIAIIISNFTSCVATPMVARLVLLKKDSLCFWLNRILSIFSGLPKGELEKLRKTNRILLTIAVGGFIILFIVSSTMPRKIAKEQSVSLVSQGIFAYCTTLTFYIVAMENKLFVQHFLFYVNMIRLYYVEANKAFSTKTLGTDWRSWTVYIRQLRSKNLEVHDFISFLHKFFAPIVTLQFLWGFYTVLFNMVMTRKYGIPPVLQTMWAAYVAWDFISVCAWCHFAEKEAEKMTQYMQNCFINCETPILKEEIELFSLQTQHHKIEFHLMGFFKIDLSLIYSVIGALVSYCVIFFQFSDPTSDDSDCFIKIPRNCSSGIIPSK